MDQVLRHKITGIFDLSGSVTGDMLFASLWLTCVPLFPSHVRPCSRTAEGHPSFSILFHENVFLFSLLVSFSVFFSEIKDPIAKRVYFITHVQVSICSIYICLVFIRVFFLKILISRSKLGRSVTMCFCRSAVGVRFLLE